MRHPDFPNKARTIVVEFGNALYQPILDRYIAGENVPLSKLQQGWQNTTQVSRTLDSSVYSSFFAAVREVNRGLPPSKRIKVFAGDPPIDWSQVRTAEEYQAIVIHRDDYPASLLRDRVLGHGEKALIITEVPIFDRTLP